MELVITLQLHSSQIILQLMIINEESPFYINEKPHLALKMQTLRNHLHFERIYPASIDFPSAKGIEHPLGDRWPH